MVATVKTRKVQAFDSLGKHSELQKIMKWVPDLSSCGIFTLIYMRRGANGYKPIDISSQSEVELARKCIAIEIFLGKLAEPLDYPLFLNEVVETYCKLTTFTYKRRPKP
ncbi:hypothetical protein ACFE04_005030 [Oxalis oulophora]